MEPRSVSVIIPCLNEEKTLPFVLQDISDSFSGAGYNVEILVADNGSHDRSPEIARRMGATVISVSERGYGAALLGGISSCRGDVILFGDADHTYDFGRGPAFVEELLDGDAELVIGSRMTGGAERGSMPWLHRNFGTPALSLLISVLFRGKVTDCNSGFRAFRKSSFDKWGVRSQGMEFASELIVNCLRSGGKIQELPIPFRRNPGDRIPHLQTWRDGMRHLLFILSRAPHGFSYMGGLLGGLSLLVATASFLFGPSRLGPFYVFDYHTVILSILLGVIGTQAAIYGLLLDMKSARPLPWNSYLLRIREETLLKILAVHLLAAAGFACAVAVSWASHGFASIHYLRASLFTLYFVTVLGSFVFGLLMAHVCQRVWR